MPEMPGRRIGVVTGTAMSPLMADLVRELETQTKARFEVITAKNSLFGPGVTTAGLLVGADMRRELLGRIDLDLVLIPAQSINEDGLFLDDVPFETLRAALPMPVLASYDFIDVLAGEPDELLAGVA